MITNLRHTKIIKFWEKFYSLHFLLIAYFRSKISVYENRTSAQGIGILGILVIVVVFLFILSLDFIPLG